MRNVHEYSKLLSGETLFEYSSLPFVIFFKIIFEFHWWKVLVIHLSLVKCLLKLSYSEEILKPIHTHTGGLSTSKEQGVRNFFEYA